MFDVLRFYKDFRIDHISSSHKHARKGWVQIHCPFCVGSKNYSLGFNLHEDYYTCWRCRGKSIVDVVKKMANVGFADAQKIIQQYHISTRSIGQQKIITHNEGVVTKLPPGCGPLTTRHRDYLEGRHIDAALIEKYYGIQATGPLGEYKHRIIAPIMFEGELVSYQGRAISSKAELKYKACAMKNEAIHHKHIMYGWDLAKGNSCAIVEGIFDDWRLGPGAIGTFGTGYTQEQANLISKRFSRSFVVFDPEPAAQAVAEELAWSLGYRGVETVIVEIDGTDPGGMPQDDADALMRELGLTGWNKK